MSKHTPGSWSLNKEDNIITGADGSLVVADGTGAFIAIGNDQDALLIAAAPDLLAAVLAMQKAWLDYHDAHSLTEPVTGRAGNAMDLATEAIAKATGE
jgi:hypothetical protein